jgi:hypothetical protein
MYKIKIYSLKKVKKTDKYFNQLIFVQVPGSDWRALLRK